MNADAYAGFLKLLLTPTSKEFEVTADVAAYLRYANTREPLPVMVRPSLQAPSIQSLYMVLCP